MRLPPPWVIAVFVVSLAGVGIDAVRAKPATSLASAITDAHTPTAHTPLANASTARNGVEPLRAALVLQASDCTGNFRMFNLLHRHDVRGAIGVVVIWYVGADADSLAIRAAMPTWMRDAELRRAPPAVLFELSRMGHRTTPVLLMLDDSGRLRFATQSPRSAREFAGLQRIITGLTWTEER